VGIQRGGAEDAYVAEKETRIQRVKVGMHRGGNWECSRVERWDSRGGKPLFQTKHYAKRLLPVEYVSTSENNKKEAAPRSEDQISPVPE
jgi:hypothetical protein